jgi:isocitrate lyase
MAGCSRCQFIRRNVSGSVIVPGQFSSFCVKKINNALLRADQIQSVNGGGEKEYLVPIIADAEAGFGEI